VVGQLGGDSLDVVQGPTSVPLVPGITYVYNWFASIQDLRADSGDTGATASGFFRIVFLPEPSPLLLLLAALAALVLRAAKRAQGRPDR
jgi:hypothetical protein